MGRGNLFYYLFGFLFVFWFFFALFILSVIRSTPHDTKTAWRAVR